MSDLDCIEVLYQIRLALEDVYAIKRVPFVKMYLENAERLLVEYLRRQGLDPGKGALDADALKLSILKNGGR